MNLKKNPTDLWYLNLKKLENNACLQFLVKFFLCILGNSRHKSKCILASYQYVVSHPCAAYSSNLRIIDAELVPLALSNKIWIQTTSCFCLFNRISGANYIKDSKILKRCIYTICSQSPLEDS